jgi:AbrB family looped-hinge helix DNA binding protein
MPDTRLTEKGQVTIPLEIRELLGLKPKDPVRFEVIDGKVQIKPAPSMLERHFRRVPVPSPAHDWRAERSAFEQSMADDAEIQGRS